MFFSRHVWRGREDKCNYADVIGINGIAGSYPYSTDGSSICAQMQQIALGVARIAAASFICVEGPNSVTTRVGTFLAPFPIHFCCADGCVFFQTEDCGTKD